MAKAVFHISGSTKPLRGTIEVRGAKNDILKGLAAVLLTRGDIAYTNMPDIEDVRRTLELLKSLGVQMTDRTTRVCTLNASHIKGHILRRDIAEQIRASIVLAGPLLARQGKVRFPFPGGCVLGKRPIDLFVHGWSAMGARMRLVGDEYEFSASRLHGADITFYKVSVTGTEAMMFSAVLAHGTTVLRNAALEPEIPHLADFLNSLGARIHGAGTPTITIEGTDGKLLEGPGQFATLPDRIEAGSFAALVAARGGKVKITSCNPEHLAVPIEILREMGVRVTAGKDFMLIESKGKLKPIDMIKTREYPGFPTDLQAPFTVLLTRARGASLVFETIFEGRLAYIDDLNRMGAAITICDPHRVLVNGPTELRGRHMESPDIRAGLAFVIAAAIAKGPSVLEGIYKIDRGYEKIEMRLRRIGVAIERKKS
ncbi:MAG: UDP-N-acetylglucosamine 1-carboxyvinyltransferase [Candidatus Ryanbacteria bacterium]|nr:UDP-N-acetylglucosamine 1-carboxyvinyltransferase [Candidatus Ryanbacteria bacterium]